MSRGRVAICTPSWERPTDSYLAALEASVPALDAAGWEHHAAFEVTNPYISAARASMLGKALDWGADVVVFIDDDVSWEPQDLVKLLDTEGEVVGGNYRYKTEEEVRFMGKPILGETFKPIVRESDGAVQMMAVPAGFLKIDAHAVIPRFLEWYPHLRMNWTSKKPNVDLFNHGVFNGTWFGEDFAFCRNWMGTGGDIWCPPDMNLTHNARGYYAKDKATGEVKWTPEKPYPSNYHRYLLSYKPKPEDGEAKMAA